MNNIAKKESFQFTADNLQKANEYVAKYPKGKQRSALMPLLYLAQSQNDNWLPQDALDYIADFLSIPPIKVYEVATFYTMFNLKPVGKNYIQVCRTTPCWLRGSDKITNKCKEKLGIDIGETTSDGKFSLIEVECLGACVNAPMVQINDNYYEDLSEESIEQIIDDLADDKEINIGSQIGRQGSAPLKQTENTDS